MLLPSLRAEAVRKKEGEGAELTSEELTFLHE